jgi:hypothetical protein
LVLAMFCWSLNNLFAVNSRAELQLKVSTAK